MEFGVAVVGRAVVVVVVVVAAVVSAVLDVAVVVVRVVVDVTVVVVRVVVVVTGSRGHIKSWARGKFQQINPLSSCLIIKI